ncbi:hypothetical protein K491DRAFT_680451 [Lophiostoma macrostomum CBS 122681]|uniref:Uncharacterized protein n=1 Tax=Lophiostoma macrostomum CBS 122681 TaxID=1314788 RepID=A0A6A6T179_9PLEO|nr:hypothetical protein K491DRAFT_680451 [Lophiostoma macrostomum CBS 122681]
MTTTVFVAQQYTPRCASQKGAPDIATYGRIRWTLMLSHTRDLCVVRNVSSQSGPVCETSALSCQLYDFRCFRPHDGHPGHTAESEPWNEPNENFDVATRSQLLEQADGDLVLREMHTVGTLNRSVDHADSVSQSWQTRQVTWTSKKRDGCFRSNAIMPDGQFECRNAVHMQAPK